MNFMKWTVGDVTITKVPELDRVPGMRGLIPQATKEAIAPIGWLQPHFVTEDLKMLASIHALVVEAGGRRILVDTCVGNDKDRAFDAWNHMQGPFLQDLEAAGFPRRSIDTVLCTHLHIDHVGWNTMREGDRWVPTFPNARYLMGREEFDYWKAEADADDALPDGDKGMLETGQVFGDSVRPVFEAGLVDLVETEHRLCDEVRLIPTVGHTPGHVSVMIESRGEAALITGDFMHHPCQIARPEWAAAVDYDSAQSTRTRREMFELLADTPTLVIGTHFASPTAGRLVRDGDSFRLVV
jgi:glyoxylase-like metal-dependent hydrolase (beta-lactamase superfamily II)